MKPVKYIPPTEVEVIRAKKLKIAYSRWLEKKCVKMNIAACWHVPAAMRWHFDGYTADWLAKELKRYFNKVNRRIYKAASKNRGLKLQRVITLEYDPEVGWHAHGLLACGPGMNEQETIDVLENLWTKQTKRFVTGKFEKHCFWAQSDKGKYLSYISKRVHRQNEIDVGFLDTINTYLLDH